MNENDLPRGSGGNSVDFAPADYSDRRQPLEWQTRYPREARKKILYEAIYLAIVFALFVAGIFAVLLFRTSTESDGVRAADTPWLGCMCAWLAGTVGGTIFSIKWLYHSVAKQMWHEDRLLWRIFAPHVSGAVAFFTLLLTASGLLQIFNAKVIEQPIQVLGFGFLVGYFSDKALAKLAETADTLFGALKKT